LPALPQSRKGSQAGDLSNGQASKTFPFEAGRLQALR
jgi:hypothetical protein